MELYSAHNAFAFHLCKSFALANEGKNFLLSPVSIFATLSMILPGARQLTLHQMLDAMRLNSSAPFEETQAALGKMLAAAVGTDGASASELLMANKAYIESGYQVHQEYLTALHKYFAAELASARFSAIPDTERTRINAWVATVTKGKIQDLLKPGTVSKDTRLVLVNALYFKAQWSIPFNKKLTREEPFETRANSAAVSVQMMYQTRSFPIIRVSKLLTGVRFDFSGGDAGSGQRLSMFAILPAERHGLDSLLSGMTQDDWLRVISAPAEMKRAEVALPRVRLSGEAELSEPRFLPSLGIRDIFKDNAANLSGISSERLFVSSVAHKAVLEWDEVGAEGVAATDGVIGSRSQPAEIRFDQPFLVIIAKEVASAAAVTGVQRVPVFMGRVSDPRQG